MVKRRRKDRLLTDSLREVRNTFSRFLSILVLSALAVAFLAGLRATAPDMEFTADNYFDRTVYMDGYVLSTLGIVEEDLEVLAARDEILDVEGIWNLDAIAGDAIVSVRSMPQKMNFLDVTEGRLPEAPDECVTESLLLTQLGLELGDQITLAPGEDNKDSLSRLEYTVVGVVTSPLYVNTDRGSSSLGGGSLDAFLYIPGENFNMDYYTAAYFTFRGLGEMDSYSDAYEDKLEEFIDSLDDLAEIRAQARTDSVKGDAQKEIDDAQKELDDAREEAEQELADAWQELLDARQELDDGWAEYYDGVSTFHTEIADAEKELSDAHVELLDGERDLEDGKQKYADGLKEYENGKVEYEDGLQKYLDGETEYADALQQWQDGKAEYDDGLVKYQDGQKEYEDGLKELEDGETEYADGLKEFQDGEQELIDARKELEDGETEYADGLKEFQDGEQKLIDARKELEDGEAEYADGLKEFQDGEQELIDGRKELEDGEAEYADGLKEFRDGEQKLIDARQQLEDGEAEYSAGKAEYNSGVRSYEEGRKRLEESQAQYDAGVAQAAAGKQELDTQQAQYDAGRSALDAGRAQFEASLGGVTYEDAVGQLQHGIDTYQVVQDAVSQQVTNLQSSQQDIQRQIDETQQQIADPANEANKADLEAKKAGLESEYQQAEQQMTVLEQQNSAMEEEKQALQAQKNRLEDSKNALDQNEAALNEGKAKLDAGWTAYNEGQAALAASGKQLEDGWAELSAGRAQLDQASSALQSGRRELDDGWAELKDGEATLAESRGTLADARKQLDDGWAELKDGESTLEENRGTLADARKELDDGWAELKDGETTLEENRVTLADARKELDDGWAELKDGEATLEENRVTLADARKELDDGWAELKDAEVTLQDSWVELEDARIELDDGWTELVDARTTLDDSHTELEDARVELEDAQRELDDARQEIEDGERDLADGWAEYQNGLVELADARTDGQKELNDAYAELNDGETEYAEGLKEYEDGRAEADEEIGDAQVKLDDARQELADVADCTWYVLGRNTNSGFAGYSQDAERVGNLASIFPIIFFLVAALACLTTMTRMVEDQRSQIGALKAMGFSRLAISKKYIGYALSASLLGGLLGLLLGCTLIPMVIANAFNIMYDIPKLEFKAQVPMFALAVLAAVVCTTGAGLWACLSTLVDTPANLMRPRAPKPGKRVFLERITPIWSRLNFTWKVTMRNLFRYKRRFWMTVIGIGGCTALIVTGFGLHDSIFSILNRQFDEISNYDATVALNPDRTPEEMSEVEAYLNESPYVEKWMNSSQTSVESSSTGPAYLTNLFAIDDMEEFTQFIDLRHRNDDAPVEMTDDTVIISEKLSELLDVKVGDTFTVKKDDLRVEATVGDIVENYVQHYIYMSGNLYKELFREDPELNVSLLVYGEDVSEESNPVPTDLMAMEGVSAYSYIATIRDAFTDSMVAIDYAVVIVIVAAAALAFVVLYNLTNINITERTRELATLKVLGFYDKETTAYVYRENIFLTVFGILLGLVMGRFLHSWLVLTVEVDLVMFGRTAPGYAYVLAAILTVVFSVVVNIAAHFKLKKVDMVESLKSVE